MSAAELDALLDELATEPDDLEHPSVSVVHDSNWALAVYTSGLVTLEHVEDLDIEPRHLRVSAPVEARGLMGAMAEGRQEDVFAADWQAGYGH